MNSIAIRREDLSKKGEQRVAVTPREVQDLVNMGTSVTVQPASHPKTGERKRAFDDKAYQAAGATVSEDIGAAKVVFGLKELESRFIQPRKVYLFFSHTHKGQVKNRGMLRKLVENKATVIDYELITDKKNQRHLTAFTYYAGYAGMVDSLWTLGQRWKGMGIESPLGTLKQSIAYANMSAARKALEQAGEIIHEKGLPGSVPPLITAFLGKGKTSQGAREMYHLLPMEEVRLEDLPEVYQSGSRHKVYQVLLGIRDMYRLKADAGIEVDAADRPAFNAAYRAHPDQFESNLDKLVPYTTMLMNCITWSPRFPRLLSREKTREWYTIEPSLQVIGDITCDPEGSIQFSHETWIDDPVFVYNPVTEEKQSGFAGAGIAVMAVTNLPCEFPVDASSQFASELAGFLPAIATADFYASSPEAAGLPPEIQRATLLWNGDFTPEFRYMEGFLGQ